jgi:hypothetical protein
VAELFGLGDFAGFEDVAGLGMTGMDSPVVSPTWPSVEVWAVMPEVMMRSYFSAGLKS